MIHQPSAEWKKMFPIGKVRIAAVLVFFLLHNRSLPIYPSTVCFQKTEANKKTLKEYVAGIRMRL